MRTYTLFVGDNCHQCAEVVSYMEINNIDFKKVNVDHSDERPPLQVFAFPVLFEEKTLIAYGTDIKQYLKKIPS